MKNRLVAYVAVFLLLASLLEGCAVVNTLVSLQYETGYPAARNACISSVTGDDLCLALQRHKVSALGCLLGFAAISGAALLQKKPEE